MNFPQTVRERKCKDCLMDSVLVGSVIHELTNPLVAIKMGLENLKQSLPTQFKNLIDPIVDAEERALFLVESIYRIYQGSTFEKKLITPLELKISLEKLLSSAEGFAGIHVQFELSEYIKIYSNLSLLTQVLFNLVKNAHNALTAHKTTRKMPLIYIQIYPENDRVVLRVGDNGPGLPVRVRKNPFKSFHKKEGGRGLGLGLYLSHLITLALSGKIEVSTEENVGTEFRIYLK